MSSTLFTSIDALAAWRRALAQGIEQLCALLDEHGLLDAHAKTQVMALKQRLATDRLVVAFVAEFSRGKSELINALFFADSGRRIMPATPGRTTMCPVELAWDPQQPPSLSLLPIATRGTGIPVAELREQPAKWRMVPMNLANPEAMARVLEQVTMTRRVTVEQARLLGFWRDDVPDDNPPRDADDMVEVPAWRHALVNLPHPLLRRGLVVIDTPGLNAIGAEPELTLSLLPSAHATVFVLAADTGVTKADQAVWRDHLGDRACERFVVLNKIDAMADPLSSVQEVEAMIERQCRQVGATLGVPADRVFPLSARNALAARVHKDEPALLASRLPALEQALLAQLLPQRSQVIGRMVEDGLLALQQSVSRRLGERGRQVSEQWQELTGLRGKSAARLKLVNHRLEAEVAECERCAPRLSALRTVLNRETQRVMDGLSAERVRAAVQRMRSDSQASLLKLGAGRAFSVLGERLRGHIAEAQGLVDELDGMLRTGQTQLNAEFGLNLAAAPRPSLEAFEHELLRIEAGYRRHVTVTQVWRLAQPGFLEQFSRMLHSRLAVVFDNAAQEIEYWTKAAATQMDEQLRDRRRALRQRREAQARVHAAESGLDNGIADLDAQLDQLQRLTARLDADVDKLRRYAALPPPSDAALATPKLQLVPGKSGAELGVA